MPRFEIGNQVLVLDDWKNCFTVKTVVSTDEIKYTHIGQWVLQAKFNQVVRDIEIPENFIMIGYERRSDKIKGQEELIGMWVKFNHFYWVPKEENGKE